MNWTTKRTISKVAMIKFNKDNNWTVNLNQTGTGTWDKKKIRYIVGVSKLNMYKYDMGYDISLESVGVSEPIYSCNFMVTRASENVVTHKQTVCPSTLNLTVQKDTSYISTVHFAKSRSHSIYLKLRVNGSLWYDTRAHRDEYKEEFRLIPIDPNNNYTIQMEGNGSSYNLYRAILNEYKVHTVRDDESEVICLFIEED